MHRRPLPTYWLLGLILLLGFFGRVHALAGQDLWGDEAFSVGVIQKPLGEVIAPGIETHPPLYHILLMPWAALIAAPASQADPFLLRFGSLILSLLVIPFTYGLARRLASPQTALLAALLVAVSPMEMYYAQEVRMYSLLALVTVMNGWAFVRLTARPSRLNWLLYLGTALAGMYTHYNAFWVLLAINVTALFSDAWAGRRRNWLAGQLVLVIIYLPWVIGQADFLLVRGGQKGAFALSITQAVTIVQQSLRSWVVGVTHSAGLVTLLAVGAALICAAVGLWWFWQRKRWQAILLAGWVGFTLVMVIAIDPIMPFVFNERFALAGLTAFAILVAQGMVRLARWQSTVATILIIVVLFGGVQSAVNWWADPNPNRALVASHDWRPETPPDQKASYADALRDVTAGLADGDLILLSNEQQGALGNYYAPPGSVFLESAEVNSPRTEAYLTSLVDDAPRAWLVEFGDPVGYDPMRLVPGWLAEHGFRQRYFSYYGGTVSLYALGADDTPLTAIDAQFGQDIRLTGYRLTPQAARPGEELRLTLRWEAINPPAARYTVGSYVLSMDMQLQGQTDAEPRGGAAPTDSWQAGDMIEDRYAIPLAADLPSGEYYVAVGLYAWPDPVRIPVSGGEHLDNALLLTTFTVGDNG